MITQAQTIVALWFVPVLLHIILPLSLLACWLLIQPFRSATKEKLFGENEITPGSRNPLSSTQN